MVECLNPANSNTSKPLLFAYIRGPKSFGYLTTTQEPPNDINTPAPLTTKTRKDAGRSIAGYLHGRNSPGFHQHARTCPARIMNRRNFLKGVASALIATRLLTPLKAEISHELVPVNATTLGPGRLVVFQNGEWREIGTVTEFSWERAGYAFPVGVSHGKIEESLTYPLHVQ